MDPFPFPYKSSIYQIPQTSRRINLKQGVKRHIEKYAWMSDGAVRNIEKGLPLINESKFSHIVDIAQTEKQIKEDEIEFLQQFVNPEYFTQQEFLDLPVPNVNSPEELKLQRLMDKIRQKRVKQLLNPSTGLVQQPPAEDIIDNIGKLHVRSVTQKVKRPTSAAPFPHPPHIDQRPKRPKSTVGLVQQQMKRVFKPNSEPFTHVDCESDFPEDDMLPPPLLDEEEEIEEEEDYSMANTPSLLLDPHAGDIYWTKNKAPFTRDEVDTLYSWRKQVNDSMANNDGKITEMLEEREKCIKRTFESRLAFERQVELVEEDCDQVVNLGPSRIDRRKKSVWKVAAKSAKKDISSLPFRKNKWERWCNFVRSNGYLSTEPHIRLSSMYRSELMSGNPANQSVFWNSLTVLDEMDYTIDNLMVFVDFLRREYNISREDLIQYMEENDLPTDFYILAVQRPVTRTKTPQASGRTTPKSKSPSIIRTKRDLFLTIPDSVKDIQ